MIELFVWGDQGWGDEMARGVLVTFELAAGAYLLGLLIGMFGAIARRSEVRALRHLAAGYSTAFRALPELVVISIIYFGGSLAVGEVLSWFGGGGYVEVDALTSGILALGLVQGAYQTEVFRGAIEAVPAGQWEAARAIGLSHGVTFFKVILPQLWRLAFPGMSNLWMTVLKETALVSAIGLEDVVRSAQMAAASTRSPFIFFTAVVVAYLAITAVSNSLIAKLEVRVNRGYAFT
jgi:His/Glu/Gln/Arg/opine family amino acid ABC transporter permease subunit